MESVVERIAEEIRDRLIASGIAVSVTRPKLIDGEPVGNHKITVTQTDRTYNEELSCPGNPPAIAFDQTFLIAGELRPSEDAADSIDTLINAYESEIRRAITSVPDWHKFNGLAIDAQLNDTQKYTSDTAEAVHVNLLVRYRHNENDDTVVQP